MPDFKSGDKVRIVESEDTVSEVDGGLGMEGVFEEWYQGNRIYAKVSSPQFVNQKSWFFKAYQLELISSVGKPVSSSKVCVRCGGEIYQKQTTDFQTGASCFIDKCKVCGYC